MTSNKSQGPSFGLFPLRRSAYRAGVSEFYSAKRKCGITGAARAAGHDRYNGSLVSYVRPIRNSLKAVFFRRCSGGGSWRLFRGRTRLRLASFPRKRDSSVA